MHLTRTIRNTRKQLKPAFAHPSRRILCRNTDYASPYVPVDLRPTFTDRIDLPGCALTVNPFYDKVSCGYTNNLYLPPNPHRFDSFALRPDDERSLT